MTDIYETLPQGFTRRGALIRADVDGGQWIVTADASAPIRRRYWLQYDCGPRPANLSGTIGFYASDLAQARIRLCGHGPA